jgi:hypothetical protein
MKEEKSKSLIGDKVKEDDPSVEKKTDKDKSEKKAEEVKA